MVNLSSKSALITGGANGIGAATAEFFAAHGARVLITDVSDGSGDEVAVRIRNSGGKAFYRHLDVVQEGDWEAAVDDIVDKFGSFDVLVNNAAVELYGPVDAVNIQDVQTLLDVNVKGTLLGIKHAVRAMRRGSGACVGGASIINLSSVAGLVGTPALAAYSASKGAIRAMSRAAAIECGTFGHNIRVNAIHPGFIETEMSHKMLETFVDLGFATSVDEAKENVLLEHPLGRLGAPVDVAKAAAFLASDLSSWITGIELSVDGGFSAR
ncbi:glucose 1-dehydrogenase [Caballeronia novacaledonica]|uniref:Glucose 1-dehydrogenase n=1 Tax=Caballeronia novacaledonica TaxID=1544861 RepID=A0ACB5R5T2_9BURK|nr:glucose 1-dehydrogenase [Caballeronia sp. LZ029]MDR5748867.1 glucose 1-dehydrogenase [Caballeronia sp. LZ029]GJH22557.1 glucose 1-dehydrogenase [Caballeronia novacaledonica]